MIKTAVSLYSYQDEYVRGKMTLEDCIKELADHHVDGVEILPDQMLKKAPLVSDEDVKHFRNLLEKYNVAPVCNDIFINTKLYNNRILTHDENLALLEKELHLAHRMGMKMVRLVSMTPTDIIEDALPLAEKLDVCMALEIHAGMAFDVPQTKAFTDIMFRVQSPYLGLVVDTGIFCYRPPRVFRKFFEHQGTNPALADYVEKIYPQHETISFINNPATRPQEIKDLAKTEIDQVYLALADGYENHPFTLLDKYMPYVKHFHAKTFEMLDDTEEYSIHFAEFIDYLQSRNYDGYIATEYEGGRFVLPGNEVQAVEQVRRQQKMMQSLIGRK